MSETVARLHDAFMDSSDHRANVLSGSFEQVGVGVEIREDQLWVTVYFRDHDGARTPEPEPDHVSPTEPEPDPKREPEPEAVDPMTVHTYMLLRRLELLESATGL